MKYQFLTWTLVCMIFNGFSQEKKPDWKYDFDHINFSKLKEKEVVRKRQQVMDSLQKTYVVDSLNELLLRMHARDLSFGGFMLGVNFPSAHITEVNKALTENQFPPLSTHFTELGFGFVGKQKHWIEELLYAFSFTNSSKSGDTKVGLWEANIALQAGYAVVNNKYFILYPFTGLSFETFLLSVDAATSSTSTNLFGIAAAYQKTTITRNQLQGNAGLAGDFYVLHPGKKNPGLLLGGRYGLGTKLLDGNYRANGHRIDYHPDIRFRNNYWGISLKLVGL